MYNEKLYRRRKKGNDSRENIGNDDGVMAYSACISHSGAAYHILIIMYRL